MAFADFWAAFPRHEAKKDAQKAWTKLNPSPALEAQILQALDWQRLQPSWLKDDGQYVPLPASWIRGERWEDERRNGDRRRTAEDYRARLAACQHVPRCGSSSIHETRLILDAGKAS